MTLDKLHEMNRVNFIANRDGIEAAATYVLQLKKIYLAALKKHGKKHPFHLEYLKSAYSSRYIIRNFEDLVHV